MNTLSPKDRKRSRQKPIQEPLQEEDVPWFMVPSLETLEKLAEQDNPWLPEPTLRALQKMEEQDPWPSGPVSRILEKISKRDNSPPIQADKEDKEIEGEKPHVKDMKSRPAHNTWHIKDVGELLFGCGISGLIFSTLLNSFEFGILSMFCIISGFGLAVAGSQEGIPIKELGVIVFLAIFITFWILAFTQVTGITNIPWRDPGWPGIPGGPP